MQIVQSQAFEGPNTWSGRPVLVCHIEGVCGSTLDISEFRRCQDAFSEAKLNLSLWNEKLVWPNAIAWLVRTLQNESGVTTRPLSARHSGDAKNVAVVGVEYEEAELALACFESALALFRKIHDGDSIAWKHEKRKLVNLADDVRLGPSSRAILRAATARGIPYHRLYFGSLVQLGEGKEQRRIWTAETDATSAIAESIAKDKELTRSILSSLGIAVPKGRVVTSREEAWAASEEIGLPVAVKPRDGNHARGVSLDLTDQASIQAAYDWACKDGKTNEVIVEQYARGDHHRLLVIGDKMIAAAKGSREFVIGDGKSTIRELVEEVNRHPLRGPNFTDPLGVLKLDDAAIIELAKQNYQADSVPPVGDKVLVRHVGDLIEDCTDRVHPSTSADVVLAAKIVGLDIAGMDMVVSDISQPLDSQNGCIIEVNAGPSLAHHVAPLIGEAQPVGEAIVDLLFPDSNRSAKAIYLEAGRSSIHERRDAAESATSHVQYKRSRYSDRGRVPMILIVSRTPDGPLIDAIDAEWSKSRNAVGIADHRSIRCGKHNILLPVATEQLRSKKDDCEPIQQSLSIHAKSIRDLLMHPYLDGLLISCTVDQILEFGIPSPRADVVVLSKDLFVTNKSKSAGDWITPTLMAAINSLYDEGVLISPVDFKASTKLDQPFVRAFELVYTALPTNRLRVTEDCREMIAALS